MMRIRVIIADDHPVLRQGIKTLLQAYHQIEIIAEATTGQEALEFVKALRPDVLLLDANLPDCDGVEIAETLCNSEISVKILVLSAYDDLSYVRRFTAAGVAGYLLKDEAAAFLGQAVEAVAQGETGWFSQRIKMQISHLAQMEFTKLQLSKRELEVLRQLAAGKTNYAIAQVLNISEKTVEKHLDAIYRKLDVHSRTEAAVTAVRDNLI
jgi:two-component system, NarL family, response regulator DegU